MKIPSQELIFFFMVLIAFKNTFCCCCCCFKQKENMTFSPYRLHLFFSLSTEHSISPSRHLLPAKLNLEPCCVSHMTRFYTFCASASLLPHILNDMEEGFYSCLFFSRSKRIKHRDAMDLERNNINGILSWHLTQNIIPKTTKSSLSTEL